jgi:hypothetical protein
MSDAKDGTQLWRITHNGVDTHPIHFHLFDVQVINRVTWDNIIIPNDANENGWKDTVRMSPLEDTIVALRPIIPQVPFEVPNSVRPLNPMMPAGSTAMFFNTDPQGNPLATNITNQTINFGWEYVWHCHILSHEEMDMMRPVSLAMPPLKATLTAAALTGTAPNQRFRLTWTDNSITETRFAVERTTDGTTWTEVGSSPQPLGDTNTHGTRTFTDPTSSATTAYLYRIVAENTVGYGSGMPSMTAKSLSNTFGVNAPTAPTGLTASLVTAPGGLPSRVVLSWTDTATTEAGFVIQRSTDNGVTFTNLGTAPAKTGTGTATYTDSATTLNATYVYRVAAQNVAGTSTYATSAPITVLNAPAVPVTLTGTSIRTGTTQTDTITWGAVPSATSYRIQRSLSSTFASGITTVTVGAVTTYTVTGLSRNIWYFRVAAVNALGTSSNSATRSVPVAP